MARFATGAFPVARLNKNFSPAIGIVAGVLFQKRSMKIGRSIDLQTLYESGICAYRAQKRPFYAFTLQTMDLSSVRENERVDMAQLAVKAHPGSE